VTNFAYLVVASHLHDAESVRRITADVQDGVPAGSLLEAPLGNHLVLFLGRHRTRLERWWGLAFGAA
jgi:hypothetical protein